MNDTFLRKSPISHELYKLNMDGKIKGMLEAYTTKTNSFTDVNKT